VKLLPPLLRSEKLSYLRLPLKLLSHVNAGRSVKNGKVSVADHHW